MKTFEDAFRVLMGTEQGFWDDPVGGPTMWGVTERVARLWGYKGDMRDLPLPVARDIAKKEYWDRFKCDQMPVAIAFQVFDTAYNGGRPVLWLQKALGVTQDGKLGPLTLAATQSADPCRVALLFNTERLRYMSSLTNWSANSRGWVRRIADNLELAAQP